MKVEDSKRGKEGQKNYKTDHNQVNIDFPLSIITLFFKTSLLEYNCFTMVY